MTERNSDQGIKVDVGESEGRLQPEEFLDWVDRVDQFFEWKECLIERK